MVVASKLVFDNPVFSMFAFHSSVLVAKMLLVTLRTSLARIASKCFSNDEDIQAFTDGNNTKAVGHGSGDEFVERCRRAHLNDLENILPFLAVGLLYVLTNPTPKAAGCHFRIFTAVRVLHSIVYIGAWPQPSRTFLFYIGLITLASMLLSVVNSCPFMW
ncbi:Microsomal glutathione S-transferase 1 [Trichoplax sp. H2]|nr:Microsomal glutathione S-transferase 1 [Trichoplax sp. H2]|eukprot:RDD44430.1 Microsomal glutathione S-transferase 1 [Trichoplax sp. H2]